MSASAPGNRGIYRVVRRIPRGKVATYGQIATLVGIPRQPRRVGYALHALPEGSDVPWQRVINAKGEVSPRSAPGAEGLQRAILEREGVVFDARGRVDLGRHQWQPRGTAATRARGCGSGRPARRRARSGRGEPPPKGP